MTAMERRTTENSYAWSIALRHHRRLYELIALRPMTHLEERNYIRCVFASQLTQAELHTLLNLAGPYPTGFGQLQRGIYDEDALGSLLREHGDAFPQTYDPAQALVPHHDRIALHGPPFPPPAATRAYDESEWQRAPAWRLGRLQQDMLQHQRQEDDDVLDWVVSFQHFRASYELLLDEVMPLTDEAKFIGQTFAAQITLRTQRNAASALATCAPARITSPH